LQLSRLGIHCTIIDKAKFPRDKVCGDGLSGKVITVLEKIDPLIARRFLAFAEKQPSWGVDFVAPGRHTMHIPYKPLFDKAIDNPNGFVCKRIHFDNFLVNEIRSSSNIDFIEDVDIREFKKVEAGYTLIDSTKTVEIHCSLVIIANGARSAFLKTGGASIKKSKELAVGIRGYYRNVGGIHKDHFIELHFLRGLLPGYLWIFPLPNGEANVGIDMLSCDVSNKKINLRRMLNEILQNDAVLKHRFKSAELVGNVDGYLLPLAARRRSISGDNYMIAGDAASMIDPLTGEGIGNAMYAGRLAALQARACNESKNYSASMLAGYDKEVYRVLGSEFKLSKRLQLLARYPRLFNWLMKKGSKSPELEHLVSRMLYDVKLRKQLASPMFYFNLIFRK